MLQVIVVLAVLFFVFGGLFAITLSRKEGRELKKSCGCDIPGQSGESSSCISKCEQ